MNEKDCEFIIGIVRERSGLVLTLDKSYLLEARLLPLARQWEMKTLDELVQRLRQAPDPALIRQVVEALMTHETFFFRDLAPFDEFRDTILPGMLKARAASRKLRIWCAACSAGQEAYSLAMILAEERFKFSDWDVEILATDLSTDVLAKARAGIYTQFEIQRGLPVQYLLKYFKQQGDRWLLDARIRDMVRFRPFNLLDTPKTLGAFDLIFCRNVLMYFDLDLKREVLKRLSGQLVPDGYLVLGGTESLIGLCDPMPSTTSQRSVYHPVTALRQQSAVPA